MTTKRNIQDILEGMYGVDLSPPLISRLTYRMLPRLEEWQLRPLGLVYGGENIDGLAVFSTR